MADAENRDSKKSPEPKDAATVILMRESSDSGHEVFLMRRNTNQKFMGGALVFPGGKVDRGLDMSERLFPLARGLSLEKAPGALHEPGLSGSQAFGIFFAAIRETFEETGVMLACYGTGRPIDFSDAATKKRYKEYRLKVHQKKISMFDIAKAEDLCFPLDLLTPYAHWITPEIESRRYDTRFFLATIPEGQTAVHDAVELTDSVWISPKRALAKQQQGEMLLMPPTLKTMEELSKYRSVEDVLAGSSNRRLPTILPQFIQEQNCITILLPHDPEYGIESHRQPHRPDETSRIIMQDGLWQTRCPGRRTD